MANFLKRVTNIIVHKTIAEIPKLYQKPKRFSFNFNPKKHPRGIDTSQYEIKFAIITTLVFFIPLKTPARATCKPSNT